MRPQTVVLIALGLFMSAPVFAAEKDAIAALAAAERAYQAVDFPATREQAQHALEAGGAAPQQTARLHVLLGISAAALGEVDEAKQHFVIALAVDPSLRLDKTLSPKIRGPYLEAQGYWSAAGERLALTAMPTNDHTHLIARLQDPASLVSNLRLRLNAKDSREISERTLEPAQETRFAIPARLREHDYEYVLRALDRYGNVLSERGSDGNPELVRQGARDSARAETPRGRSYLLPAALAVTGLGAVAAGVVFNVKREQAAHEWNGPHCENPGFTRQQQCENVDSRIQSNERLAVGFYAGGGALIAGSVIALLAGRPVPAPSERASATVGCSLVGPGVSCLGHF
jgi:tetratricopeptide (TPR) repeat protein